MSNIIKGETMGNFDDDAREIIKKVLRIASTYNENLKFKEEIQNDEELIKELNDYLEKFLDGGD